MQKISGKRTFAFGLLAVLFVVNWFVLASVFSSVTRHPLRVSIFSVGEGRAVLIQSPTGTSVLLDAGPDRSVLRALSKKLGPFNRELSLVIQTSISSGAISGMPSVFERYNPKVFMTTGAPNNTLSTRLVARAEGADSRLKHITANSGMRINIGGGAFIEVLYPDKTGLLSAQKNNAIVLRLVYGKTAFLFPSDVPMSVQKALATHTSEKQLSANVFLVGHYGAPQSVDASFLKKIHPDTAVISVGRNPYGYPNSQTVHELRTVGAHVLSTRVNGTITFSSDGKSISASLVRANI